MPKQAACNHDRLIAEREASQERDRRFEAGVEKLMEPHAPYPEAEGIRPGNSYRTVRFWCERCRTPWPCQTLNDLRWLYGEVREWAAAKAPYQPLELHRAPDSHHV